MECDPIQFANAILGRRILRQAGRAQLATGKDVFQPVGRLTGSGFDNRPYSLQGSIPLHKLDRVRDHLVWKDCSTRNPTRADRSVRTMY
jgi:hypothetical protein